MPLPSDASTEKSPPPASATLPSNGGNAFLRMDFAVPKQTGEPSEIEANIHVAVPDWADGRPAPWEIKLSSLWLDPAAIRIMTRRLDLWLNLPFDELGASKLAESFELTARRYQRFRVSFGERDDTISGTNNSVSITIEGGMKAVCHFVIDVSCIQRFADELRAATSQ